MAVATRSSTHRAWPAALVAVTLLLTGCASASPAGHELAVQTRTVTAAPSTVIKYSPAPSSVSSHKAAVPSSRAAMTPATTPRTTAAKPKLAVAPKSTAAAGLCGAPANPFGYTFCGGQVITTPDPAVCDYFACIPYFPNGKGYMEQCRDGMYSMSGGRRGACSSHGGEQQPVLKG